MGYCGILRVLRVLLGTEPGLQVTVGYIGVPLGTKGNCGILQGTKGTKEYYRVLGGISGYWGVLEGTYCRVMQGSGGTAVYCKVMHSTGGHSWVLRVLWGPGEYCKPSVSTVLTCSPLIPCSTINTPKYSETPHSYPQDPAILR